MCILLTTSAFAADGCATNESCTWYVSGATGDGVNISFTYPNQTTTEEFAMISLGSGKYLYTTTFNIIGNVMGCARSYNVSDTIQTACESKEINYDIQEEFNLLGSILQPFLIFLIGAMLVYLGLKGDTQSSHIWTLSGGIWWLGYAGVMVYSGQWITSLFYILLSIATMFIGVSNLND